MRILVILMSILLCIGCSSVQPIKRSTSETYISSIDIGDTVIIETVEGGTHKFTVSEVTEDNIRGPGLQVPLSQIAELSKVEPSKSKTLTVVAVGALAAFLLFAVDGAYLGGH